VDPALSNPFHVTALSKYGAPSINSPPSLDSNSTGRDISAFTTTPRPAPVQSMANKTNKHMSTSCRNLLNAMILGKKARIEIEDGRFGAYHHTSSCQALERLWPLAFIIPKLRRQRSSEYLFCNCTKPSLQLSIVFACQICWVCSYFCFF